MVKTYIITSTNHRTGRSRDTRPLTLDEAIDYHSYTLERGLSYQHEKGNKKINRRPSTMKSLITNLNNSVNNAAADGYGGESYSAVRGTGFAGLPVN